MQVDIEVFYFNCKRMEIWSGIAKIKMTPNNLQLAKASMMKRNSPCSAVLLLWWLGLGGGTGGCFGAAGAGEVKWAGTLGGVSWSPDGADVTAMLRELSKFKDTVRGGGLAMGGAEEEEDDEDDDDVDGAWAGSVEE